MGTALGDVASTPVVEATTLLERGAADAASPPAPRLAHEPALDGLRGLAVAAVLAFHLERLDGGFLGVDLFFVLSGFLITSLLVVERRSRGAIDLRRFWIRRARRLLPALLLLLLSVAVLLVVLTPSDQRARFRGDGVATLGYVANWHRMSSEVSYWDAFNQPSPLDHTWSLAIEEQFYVVWPVVALLVLVGLRRTRSLRPATLGGLALIGAAASFALLAAAYDPLDTSRAYFGTDTRIGATLLGAALACALAGRPHLGEAMGIGSRTFEAMGAGGRPALPRNGRTRPLLPRLVLLAGVVGLAWMVWSMVTVDGLSPWYYRGGLVLFAAASAVVIAAVTGGRGGVLGRVLSWAPLRGLGVISYGVYLWHWPVRVYLTDERANLDGWRLDLLRVALTLAIAIASYVLVERPIRHGALRGTRLAFSGLGATGVALVAILLATAGTPPPSIDEGHGLAGVPVEGSDDPYLLYPAEIPTGGRRVMMVGDSGAHASGSALVEVGAERGVTVATSAPYHCNVVIPEGVDRLPDGTILDRAECARKRHKLWREMLDHLDPDVVVYYLANGGSPAEVRLDGDWVIDCDPAFDRYLTDALREEAELLASRGALVVFTNAPYNNIPDATAADRIDCRNATLRAVVDSVPGTALVDLQGFVQQQTDAGVEMFEDMVHFSDDGSRRFATWLLEEVGPLLDE